ncbi:fungal pheromone mating factor STE2 GPCR-domain-containing protein [Hypoxylon sp. FL1857]|nr:fungal pheromone mating factor STE2 GPCR-domain-containing protein [Hypoxylon sp. FL1857]
MAAPFDPRNQTFFILGLPSANQTNPNLNTSNPYPQIAISMTTIDAQRVRLANTSINYGVQLGLCLSSLLTTLLLLPTRKLRRPVHLAQTLCLTVSITRLVLLVLYFPGPLTEYYVAWTRDASVLQPREYNSITTSSALSVLQLALVETSLALQSRVLMRTWGSYCTTTPCPSSPADSSAPAQSQNQSQSRSRLSRLSRRRRRRGAGNCWWRPAVLLFAIALAVSAVGVRAVWIAQYTKALKGHTLPVPLDSWGAAAVVLAAASIFYFCGVFFAHLALHLAATRRVLRGKMRGRKVSIITLTLREGSSRGLTSLEILAVGNGILMLAPCLFAGLDIAAGPGNTRVLPFDAGSWVGTIVAAGLPLISVAAYYRGSDAGASRLRRSYQARWTNNHQRMGGGSNRNSNSNSNSNSNNRVHRRSSSLLASDDTAVLPFPPPPRPSSSTSASFHRHARTNSKTTSEDAATTPTGRSSSRYLDPRSPSDDRNAYDLEAGDVRMEVERCERNNREMERRGDKEGGRDIPV